MKTFIKLTTVLLSSTLLATFTFAQDTKVKEKTSRSEDIIIRKKGGKTEKMTIVVDGDDVTINGKPVDEFKANDVTVFKRLAPYIAGAPRVRSFRSPVAGFDDDDFDLMMPPIKSKAMLGVMTEKGENGVKVKDVTKESGAEKAGLQKDDIITKVGDAKVTTPQELVEAINKYKPEDKVDITYLRNGKENKTTATLGENKMRNFNFNYDNDFSFNTPEAPMPPMPPMDFNFRFNGKPKIGLQIQDMEEGKGVTVKDVDDDSPAAKAGLKEGDIITQINGKDIADVDELRDQVREMKEGDTAKFSYKRDGKNQTVDIKIPKRLKLADL